MTAAPEETKGASEGMDMKMVRTELKAYDAYNVSPVAIDRTDDDTLASHYKLLVDAGSIAAEGETLEDQQAKQEAFEKQQLGLAEEESAPEPEPVKATASKTTTSKSSS